MWSSTQFSSVTLKKSLMFCLSVWREVNTPTEADILSHARIRFCIYVQIILSNKHLTYTVPVLWFSHETIMFYGSHTPDRPHTHLHSDTDRGNLACTWWMITYVRPSYMQFSSTFWRFDHVGYRVGLVVMHCSLMGAMSYHCLYGFSVKYHAVTSVSR